MASAASTDARQLDKPSHHFLQGGREVFVPEIIQVVECLVGTADIDLLRYHQRAAAEFQNLPERHEGAQAAGGCRNRAAEREDAALERGISRLVALAHARDPVDGVLQERRDRGAVFRTGNEDALMRAQHALELDRTVGRSGGGEDVDIEQRQRIVGKRNPRDVGSGKHQFLGDQSRQPPIVRARSQRAGHHQDFRSGHRRRNQVLR